MAIFGTQSKLTKETLAFFRKPVDLIRTYDMADLRPDVIAGLTIAVVLLPQAIAYALIAELPPEMGLYAAVVAAIVGALWGSSNQLQTGPTNAISLLILSTLLTTAEPGSAAFFLLAGLMAVMVGVFQLVMGLAHLGMLVNFVSHSVVVGFSSGAGVLIAFKQMRHLLGLEFSSHSLFETISGLIGNIFQTHPQTFLLGAGVILLIVLLGRFFPKLPGPLLGMIAAGIVVGFLRLDTAGVRVIGELPRGLPPIASLPFDPELIGELATGALAVAAIGLVEAMSISRTIASHTGQQLDSNQEFVGQGLANIFAGFFSGYPSSGSFTRSAVNFKSGGKTPLASVFSGVFVLVAILLLAPLAAFVPRAALAGVLIVIAFGMINLEEIKRIWQGARGDAMIMVATFFGTLFLELEFAVLLGILLSFGVYIFNTSVPRVGVVLPDENFKHFLQQPEKPSCPQMLILEISGDLYFGAVNHISKIIQQHHSDTPGQRYLMLRMQSVNHCDFSGIHTLEGIIHSYRDAGGDVFMVRVRPTILELMKSTGFYDFLGADHFLVEDEAITHMFYKILDPATCIYECPVRVFKECQNLPKQIQHLDLPDFVRMFAGDVDTVHPKLLWDDICTESPSVVVDVREPREFRRGHIPDARMVPLPHLLTSEMDLHPETQIVLVCQGGRRSKRAALALKQKGYKNVSIVEGGMLAWRSQNLLEAIEK
jgi:SulP family sulfate permease